MLHVPPDPDAALGPATPDEDRRFESLYRRWYPPIVRLCRRYLAAGHDAEAVAQEAFIRAWRSWPRYSKDRPFGPWVTAIARRLCLTEARRVARREGILSREPIDLPSSVEDGFQAAVCSQGVEHALRALSPRARRLVMLRDGEARPYEEIARIEGMSNEAARWAVKRARAAFRAAFEQTAGTPVALAAARRSWWQRARRFFEVLPWRPSSLEPVVAGAALLLAPLTPAVSSTDPPAVASAAPATVAAASASVSGPRADPDRPTVPADVAATVDDVHSAVDSVIDSVDALSVGGYSSFAVSPNHAEDRTVFALGKGRSCEMPPCAVLLRSTDGGETWSQLRAHGLAPGAAAVFLPPDYPRDGRIFVQARSSDRLTYMLAVSLDGGDSFQSLVPSGLGSMSVSMSPRFGEDDPRIFIGATSHPALVYRDDTGAVEPLRLPLPPGTMPTYFAFGRGYEGDGAMVVSASSALGARWGVYRCTPMACSTALEAPMLRQPLVAKGPDVAPGSMFAWTLDALYRSTDDGRSFERLPMPDDDPDLNVDEVLPGPRGRLFVRAHDRPTGRTLLFVSDDLGGSWSRLSVPETDSIHRLAVLPDGVLLASLSSDERTFACSTDGGVTWQSRCRRTPAFSVQ